MDESIRNIVEEFIKAFEPLTDALDPDNSPYGVYFFLNNAGIIDGIDDLPSRVTQIANKLEEIASAIATIRELLAEEKIISRKGKQAFVKIFDAVKEIDELGELTSGSIIIEDIGTRVLNYLFARYTARHQPVLYDFFRLTGALKEIEIHGEKYEQFELGTLFTLISDPKKWLQSEFGWGSDNLDTDALLTRLKLLLEKVSILAYFQFSDDTKPDSSNSLPVRLNIPIFHFEQNRRTFECGLTIEPAFLPRANSPTGISVSIYGLAENSGSLANRDFEVRYNVSASAQGGSVDIFPDNVNIRSDHGDDQLSATIYSGRKPSNEPVILIGNREGTRLEVETFGIQLSGFVGSKTDFVFELLSNGGRLVMEPGDGDGFMQKILPSNGFNINFDPSIGWSRLDGIYFNSSAGLEFTFPVHKKIGPIQVKDVLLKLTLDTHQSFTFETALAFSAKLGPVKMNLSRVGLEVDGEFKKGGNLGFLNLEGPGFSTPNIIGASLDTDLISGGGFLEIDKPNHRYAGILALQMKAIDLTGIALIATRLPNGQKGFSLLVSISAIFFPAIQLSFGFTLAGVGGLIGANRTMKIDPLRERIASGAVNSIMFPEDPIENADRIIGDLRIVFPPVDGHFVIAPFLRLGFGTPSIIEADLGVVIEVPFKGRIIILGSLGIYLPARDIGIVEIHIDVVGDFNFAEQYIQLEGRLRQSHVLSIPLKGGFAFLLDWGRRPAFLFSIGGYHPRYKKPARFPDIPRLSAMIRLGKVVKLTCKYYQAITSNSFHIGFSAFLKASAAGASLEGYYGFNTLLQFNPFFFSVDQGFSVKIKYKGHTLMGISLYFRLSGPSPWNAAGYAEISILFISLKIRFNITWGDRYDQPRTYETLDHLLDRVQESLESPANWTAKLPAKFMTGELLRPAGEINADGMALHPSGYLQVRQSVLPFDHRIEKYGNSYVKEKPRFTFDEEIKIGEVGGAIRNDQYLKENFARGQFEDLSKAEKLSTPDFESFVSGLTFDSGEEEGFDMGDDIDFVVPTEFENIVVYADQETDREPDRMFRLHPLTQRRILLRDIQQNKILTKKDDPYRFVDTSPSIMDEEEYTVVNVNDLTPVLEEGAELKFDTYGAAKQYINYELKDTSPLYEVIQTEALVTH